jgi:hypothetical protein
MYFVWSLSLALNACCLRRIDIVGFGQNTLDRQVSVYAEAAGNKCVYSERGHLLDVIASHGYSAADAMIRILDRPQSGFPPEDAIVVLEFVHFGGADLRKHPAMALLEHLAVNAQDPAVRAQAERTVQKIKSNDPLMGIERMPKG